MKKRIIKVLVSIIIPLIPILFIGITVVKNGSAWRSQQTGEIFDVNQISGDVFNNTGFSCVDTGFTCQVSDRDNFIEQKQQGLYSQFFPPEQKKLGRDNTANTQILRDYLRDNAFVFKSPSKITKGYLYIKLSKKLEKSEDIFIFIPQKVYGKLILSDTNVEKSGKEFLVSLDSIRYKRYPDNTLATFNWINNMNYFNKDNNIGLFYISTSSASHIEEFIISYNIGDDKN